MTDSILQAFLDNRFIKTADEGDIEKLKKVSQEIQKLLRKKKPKIINYTLVALDPVVAEDDPVICEVEPILIKYWKAFKNSVANTQDKPITYIQAVILDALQSLSKDIELAAIIWHSGCQIIKYYKLAGQEEVLKGFLIPIGQQVESYARANWSFTDSVTPVSMEPLNFSLPKVGQTLLNQDDIENHLKSAAVHVAWKANAGGHGDNPQTQAHNSWQWPKFFAERAAEGLSNEINISLNEQNKSISKLSSSIDKELNSIFRNLQPYIESISLSYLQSMQSQAKRGDLIWWKQSLYSNTLDKSYRQVEGIEAALAMAVDLSNSIEDIYPKSVDYFLEETLRDLLKEEIVNSIELKKFISLIPEVKNLLKVFVNDDKGRKQFGSCLALFVEGSLSEREFYNSVGMDMGTEITHSEFTVWLLHDLKAYNLANEK